MPLRRLDKSEWSAYCDRLSKDLVGSHSEVARASLAVNREAVVEWERLLGIAYEPKKDFFEITLQDVDHRVRSPQDLYVDDRPKGIAGLEIIDAAGQRHSLTLSHLLEVPRGPSGY